MNIPNHIVVFPDGNRRWAKEHNLSIQEGYISGQKKFTDFLRWCGKRGVKVITVFGFSTENWKRPQEQVDFLMSILEKYLAEGISDFIKEDVKVKIIGQRDRLPKSLQNVIETIEKVTSHHKSVQINLAISYGGKWDIVQAVKKIVEEKIAPEDITQELLESYLSTAGLPDPDLIIRAGGEVRMSNFLLWQGAYSELYFSQTLWPDFSEQDLDVALEEFDARKRRFGK